MSAPAQSPPRRRGRPPCCPPDVLERVITLHGRDFSLAGISTVLNAEGVLTPAGRPQWHKCTVDRLLHTRHAQELIARLGPMR